MGASFVITLREGLEAALIVSILLAYLNKIDRRDQHAKVWLGAGLASGISFIAGLVIFLAAEELSHTAQEAFEGVATLLAVCVLTWMIFWMRRHSMGLKGELQGKVDLALTSGSSFGLVLLSFFVVVREGLETALFLFGTLRASAEAGSSSRLLGFTGAVLGLVLALVLGWLVYRGGIKLNLRTFFRVTGALLVIVAASLVRYGLHELYEIGVFDFAAGTFLLEKVPVIGVISNIPTKVLVGLGGNPNWLEFSAWLGYLAIVGGLFLRPSRPKALPSDAVVTPQPADSADSEERQPAG